MTRSERQHERKTRRHLRRRVLWTRRPTAGGLSGRSTSQIYERGSAVCALADDFRGDMAETGDAQCARRAPGKVDHPAADERAAVIDRDDDGAAAVADTQLGAERQAAMGAGHGVLVEALARGGPVAGLVAVHRGNAGEAVASSRPDRGVGVPPRSVARRFGVLDMVPMMMPG